MLLRLDNGPESPELRREVVRVPSSPRPRAALLPPPLMPAALQLPPAATLEAESKPSSSCPIIEDWEDGMGGRRVWPLPRPPLSRLPRTSCAALPPADAASIASTPSCCSSLPSSSSPSSATAASPDCLERAPAPPIRPRPRWLVDARNPPGAPAYGCCASAAAALRRSAAARSPQDCTLFMSESPMLSPHECTLGTPTAGMCSHDGTLPPMVDMERPRAWFWTRATHLSSVASIVQLHSIAAMRCHVAISPTLTACSRSSVVGLMMVLCRFHSALGSVNVMSPSQGCVNSVSHLDTCQCGSIHCTTWSRCLSSASMMDAHLCGNSALKLSSGTMCGLVWLTRKWFTLNISPSACTGRSNSSEPSLQRRCSESLAPCACSLTTSPRLLRPTMCCGGYRPGKEEDAATADQMSAWGAVR
mmetsp:Transcript_4029/g.10041  ORF Transcript_4029/g.10041 Transcript_4029/m.10041 type:complete len:418 (-) Transcript_4029:1321-2574(-)